MQKELLFAVIGLAAGIGLSILLRKYFPSLRRGPKPKPAPPPASRQEARRREQEFLRVKDPEVYTEQQAVLKRADEVVAKLDELTTDEPELAEQSKGIRTALAKYAESMAVVVKAQTELGLYEDEGLRGELLAAADALDSTVLVTQNDGLANGFEQIRKAEGVYLNTGNEAYFDSVNQQIEAFVPQAEVDQLYLDSPADSEYEAFGDSCGERNEPSGYCVDIYGEDGGSDSSLGSIDPDNIEDSMADMYESALGLDRDQAECLASRTAESIEDGEFSEEEATTRAMEFLEDCDISLGEIGN